MVAAVGPFWMVHSLMYVMSTRIVGIIVCIIPYFLDIALFWKCPIFHRIYIYIDPDEMHYIMKYGCYLNDSFDLY